MPYQTSIGYVLTTLLCSMYSFFFFSFWLSNVSATEEIGTIHHMIIIVYAMMQINLLVTKAIPLRFKFLAHLLAFMVTVIVLYS